MSAKPINVSLPTDLRTKVKGLAESRNFSTVSGFIQHLLRREVDKDLQREKFEKMIEKGVQSGISETSPDDFFNSVRSRLREKSPQS